MFTQQTQNICVTFIERRPNVFDVGPAFYKCYTNGLCLLFKTWTNMINDRSINIALMMGHSLRGCPITEPKAITKHS